MYSYILNHSKVVLYGLVIEWGPNIQSRAASNPVVAGAGSYLRSSSLVVRLGTPGKVMVGLEAK